MNIAVCIKQVPASESKIKLQADGLALDWDGLSYVVNPYDEFALEEGLRIREGLGAGRVTVFTLGPQKAAEALRTCLAMGADQAVHMKDPCLEGGDAYATARVLTAALKREPYDLFLFGKQAIDDDNGAVGIHVAEMMGLPHVAVINKLILFPQERRAVAHRQIEGAIEVVETTLPALFTCQKGLNEPRYASLPGIMKAKQKPLTTLTLADLGLTADQVGREGAKLRLVRMDLPVANTSGRIAQGTPDEAVRELLQFLREKVKVL
jgi:electron transfer flavoprotein beta subunit